MVVHPPLGLVVCPTGAAVVGHSHLSVEGLVGLPGHLHLTLAKTTHRFLQVVPHSGVGLESGHTGGADIVIAVFVIQRGEILSGTLGSEVPGNSFRSLYLHLSRR